MFFIELVYFSTKTDSWNTVNDVFAVNNITVKHKFSQNRDIKYKV